MTEETIKIASRMKRRRKLKVAYNMSQTEPDRKIAALRMSGTYLENLGFVVGEYFLMVINDDLSITLRPITKEMIEQEEAARRIIQKTKAALIDNG